MELSTSLLQSDFLAAADAASALENGWEVSQFTLAAVGEAAVENLRRTYLMRLNHLRSKEGAHALQLARSVDEFLGRLQGTRQVEAAFIGGSAEHAFIVWRDAESSAVIGVFRTVSKLGVSAERWEQRWTDA